MKKILEALKKHGYELVHSGTDHWYFTAPGEGMRVLHGNSSGEIPELAFAALDEIERLGWKWVLSKHDDGELYVVSVRTNERVGLSEGKTKTEACCNALISVLGVK